MSHENAGDFGTVRLGRRRALSDRIENSGDSAGELGVGGIDGRIDDGDHDAIAARQAMRLIEAELCAGILRRVLGKRLPLAGPVVVVGLGVLHIRIGAERLKQRLHRAVAGKT